MTHFSMKPTLSKLKKELDHVFSLFIRQKYADHRGYVECVTCHVKKPLKEMQCGHYVGRSNLSTRWDERNCYPQCYRCNCLMKGNYPAYTEFLIQKLGQNGLLNLITEGRMIKKWSTVELKNLITHYKSKI